MPVADRNIIFVSKEKNVFVLEIVQFDFFTQMENHDLSTENFNDTQNVLKNPFKIVMRPTKDPLLKFMKYMTLFNLS